MSRLNNDIAFSVGSACTSAQQKASHVLTAMNLPQIVIEGSVRLSFGRYNTVEEVRFAVEKIKAAVNELKK
ncbi:Cysteine desulfurase [compost metagenome]